MSSSIDDLYEIADPESRAVLDALRGALAERERVQAARFHQLVEACKECETVREPETGGYPLSRWAVVSFGGAGDDTLWISSDDDHRVALVRAARSAMTYDDGFPTAYALVDLDTGERHRLAVRYVIADPLGGDDVEADGSPWPDVSAT